MKTIEERIKEYMDELFSMIDEYQVYSFKRDDFRLILEETAKVFIAEQKAIDDTELHQRFEKVLNGQKWDLIDNACEFFAAYLVEIGYPDDWCRDSEVQKSGEQRFREFMEKWI